MRKRAHATVVLHGPMVLCGDGGMRAGWVRSAMKWVEANPSPGCGANLGAVVAGDQRSTNQVEWLSVTGMRRSSRDECVEFSPHDDW
jgi:hypothetical protein